MAERDHGAGRTGDTDPAPADEVLPHIEHEHAGLGAGHGDGAQGVRHPDGRDHLRRQSPGGRLHQVGGRPARLIEPGLVPALELAAGIVFLAVVFVVGRDGPRVRHAPAVIRRDRRRRPVLEAQVDLEQEPRQAVVPGGGGDFRARRVISPVPEDNARGVRARLEEARHVVSHIEDPLVVLRQPRGEGVVADPAAVDVELAHPETGYIGGRLRDVFFEREFPAEIAGGETALLVGACGLGLEPDPARLPVRRVEQAHRPHGGIAPAGRFPVLVPGLDDPVVSLARDERAAGVFHVCRPVRIHPAAVPEVASLVGQGFGRRSDEDPVGRLALAADGRRSSRCIHDPTQPRLGRVDPQRVVERLATQPGDPDGCWIGRLLSATQPARDQDSDEDDSVDELHASLLPAGHSRAWIVTRMSFSNRTGFIRNGLRPPMPMMITALLPRRV